MASSNYLGQRLSYDGALCTVRYIGSVAGTSGTWLGVEWDDAGRGKHDGQHKDVRYFTCLSKSPTAASFVRPTRPADVAQSFVAALNGKYASEAAAEREPEIQIVFFGKKPAEEVGFDKIRRQLARVEDLTIVILDGARIAVDIQPGDKGVKETSPLISELELSRNLFEDFGQVVRICKELESLRSVKELELEETLLDWEGLCGLARMFPDLTTLSCSLNQLSTLPSVPFAHLSHTLTTLTLEFNDFNSLADLASLSLLECLRNFHLKGNNISAISPPGAPVPVFPQSLQYLDISYNAVTSWSFIDDLPTSLPGLTALRFAHNPIYERPDPEAVGGGGNQTKSTDEAYMLTIGRLGCLKALNFTTISNSDRANAEMFYLSRIARQLASVPEAAEAEVLSQHARYGELCSIYGAPDIIRRDEINPSYLEARLITVHFSNLATPGDALQTTTKTTTIPKSSDIYAVKGIAGRLFGKEPLRLRLVWETGEWDPVAGFDEEDEDADDSSDEEDAGARGGEREEAGTTQEGKAASCRVSHTMPPKSNAGPPAHEALPNRDKRGLSESMHNPRTDGDSLSSPPQPTYFIIRKSSPQDPFGTLVPLIPVDMLPAQVEVVGASRSLTIAETVGMSNLGAFDKPPGQYRLRFTSIQAEPIAIKPDGSKSTAKLAPPLQRNKSTPGPQARAPPPVMPPPQRPVLDWAEDTESVSTDDFSGAETSSGSSNNIANRRRGQQVTMARLKEKTTAQAADRLLEIAAAATAFHRTANSNNNNNSKKPPKPSKSKVGRPPGSLCRHWCQTGQCSWGTDCRYTHQMPMTLEGLSDVGLTELPSWWRKSAGLPVEGTIDVRIFSGAASGGKKSPGPTSTPGGTVSSLANPSKKSKLKAEKEDRKTAEEIHLLRLGIERAQATASSALMAGDGGKKKPGAGNAQMQPKNAQQHCVEVEKLVDI
ncbi:Tubulin-specific chaperone E [Colletotrichum musicola]|uniref:Tubulin-specific chaperone E n=1 Tax=Colletotrichum musicola TaxID=2175873 RepID=A0A8H6NZ57_9PEZI|nr:Tubulin-specific chaperone E [Colletotrichum musicola]